MATLKDVAKLACVDVSTVSRALNNTSYVHADTKERIMKAVEKLSYKPNLLAKGLRQGKRHTIGVICPTINISIFGEITQTLEQEARRLGYGVMVCTTANESAAEEACLNRLRTGFVDGIVIASTGENQHLLREIENDGISILQMVRKQDNTLSSVVGDYYASAYDGVHYLVQKGCRHIGFINGLMEVIPYRERYRGYKNALKECGLEEYLVESVVPRVNYFNDGYKGAKSLVKNVAKLDALMAANDLQGIGAIRALKELRIPVPKKIKVMSLTGLSIGGMLDNAMTSMEMPSKEMGVRIARLIIEDIEASAEHKHNLQHLVFSPTLIERETT